mgnify:CR=1 FL=1
MTAVDHTRLPPWIKLAVTQGIAAPLVYLGVVVVGAALRPGYSHYTQAVSEMTQAGADRFGLTVALTAMEALTIAFGLGFFWIVRARDRRLAASALALVAIGVVGFGFAPFPMDPVGSPMTGPGMMHLVIVTISALAAIAAVLLSALGWRRRPEARWIAVVSAVALAGMLVSGFAAAIVGANGWQGVGFWQRIYTGAFGFWQIATALFLLRHGARLRNLQAL